jgi:hypothetical protein
MKASLALLSAIAIAATSVPALAQDDLMAGYYGNTLTINIQDMWHGKLFINADHTYSMDGDNGPSKGSWTLEGSKFCFRQVDPKADPDTPTCSNFAKAYKVGDKWANTDSNQIEAGLELVKGR